MAKPGGLLAILAEGKEGKGSDSEKSEPGSAKARALKAMHAAMQAGKWDEAASEFQTAYDACAMKEGEEEAGEYPEAEEAE